MLEKLKSLIITNKAAAIITASVVGVAAIGGGTAYAVVNHNDNVGVSDSDTVSGVNKTNSKTSADAASDIETVTDEDVTAEENTDETAAEGTDVTSGQTNQAASDKKSGGKSATSAAADTTTKGSTKSQSANTTVSDTSKSTASEGHTHKWEPVTETRTIVDEEAWGETIVHYEDPYTVYECRRCGQQFLDVEALEAHMFGMVDQGDLTHGSNWSWVEYGNVWDENIEHPAVTHTEEVVYAYRCSECGASKLAD